ncbi:hypothetical protein B0H13DRAFT_1872520 [Mycena leptocephala]|nr:hypothetical protein B0H13DRAFT_1872520 [Mycena leptocephala]
MQAEDINRGHLEDIVRFALRQHHRPGKFHGERSGKLRWRERRGRMHNVNGDDTAADTSRSGRMIRCLSSSSHSRLQKCKDSLALSSYSQIHGPKLEDTSFVLLLGCFTPKIDVVLVSSVLGTPWRTERGASGGHGLADGDGDGVGERSPITDLPSLSAHRPLPSLLAGVLPHPTPEAADARGPTPLTPSLPMDIPTTDPWGGLAYPCSCACVCMPWMDLDLDLVPGIGHSRSAARPRPELRPSPPRSDPDLDRVQLHFCLRPRYDTMLASVPVAFLSALLRPARRFPTNAVRIRIPTSFRRNPPNLRLHTSSNLGHSNSGYPSCLSSSLMLSDPISLIRILEKVIDSINNTFQFMVAKYGADSPLPWHPSRDILIEKLNSSRNYTYGPVGTKSEDQRKTSAERDRESLIADPGSNGHTNGLPVALRLSPEVTATMRRKNRQKAHEDEQTLDAVEEDELVDWLRELDEWGLHLRCSLVISRVKTIVAGRTVFISTDHIGANISKQPIEDEVEVKGPAAVEVAEGAEPDVSPLATFRMHPIQTKIKRMREWMGAQARRRTMKIPPVVTGRGKQQGGRSVECKDEEPDILRTELKLPEFQPFNLSILEGILQDMSDNGDIIELVSEYGSPIIATSEDEQVQGAIIKSWMDPKAKCLCPERRAETLKLNTLIVEVISETEEIPDSQKLQGSGSAPNSGKNSKGKGDGSGERGPEYDRWHRAGRFKAAG